MRESPTRGESRTLTYFVYLRFEKKNVNYQSANEKSCVLNVFVPLKETACETGKYKSPESVSKRLDHFRVSLSFSEFPYTSVRHMRQIKLLLYAGALKDFLMLTNLLFRLLSLDA